ncbi:hypothetical protein F8O01_09295 [Pseudoclavibacter chungangensis]|uniref:histidine kinase n=1 Tax=Pseudoclavibacter chungangensis TaxID=587635 RepID=A0A7J5BTM6_9MICO|nr:histidine kinase [Pseudoclavibacter chungangensis]KAB1656836.1 hypothetical protein F8O01_09295 [Pseudoclavibacter chungangensis]NYJ67296.1 signal transduction histidine kinase [Pseudoclavibacter chungangensis]
MFRRLLPHQWWFDGVLAAVVAVVTLLSVDISVPLEPLIPLAYASAALGIGGVVLRRAAPSIALVAVTLSALTQMLSLSWPTPVNACQVLVVYACAAYGGKVLRRISLGAVVIAGIVAPSYLALVDALLDRVPGPETAAYQFIALWILTTLTLGCAWLLGLARWLTMRSAEARVQQRLAEVEQGHLRERMTVEEERGRIAREMHDVLAHSLVVIATLSDGARYAIRNDPDTADEAVRTIGGVSRDALTDVRRLLADLRHEQDSGPAATFDELTELVAQFEALGLRIDRHDDGNPQALTPGASLAAFRIVQESLTNALRHGDPSAPVSLDVRWSPHALHLRVVNRVPAPAVGVAPRFVSGGHGLIGLRERVLLEAGTFRAARAGDEFHVDAALPIGRAETLPPAEHARIEP